MSDTERNDRDRELDELLSELRVILPAATVLVAFLLTLPFTSKFSTIGGVDRAAYAVAFLAAVGALVFLVGESAYHRVRGKPYDKSKLITTASRQAVAALTLLAVTLGSVVFLVMDVVYGLVVAVPATAVAILLAAVTWFALPLARRRRG